jgi:hypothetical protein
MIIRAATADDAKAYWGKNPPASIRAYVAEHDGKVMGIAGLVYGQNQIQAFADMAEGGQKYPLAIMRITKLVKALLNETRAPVYCNADVTLPNAKKFLEHVGFKLYSGRTYVWIKE